MWFLFSAILYLFVRTVSLQDEIPPELEVIDADPSLAYKLMETTYPFKCPYRNDVKLYTWPIEYQQWLGKKDSQYGYFEDRTSYNYLLSSKNVNTNTKGDCIIFSEGEEAFPYYRLNCDEKQVHGVCFYVLNREHFCSSYHMICGTTCSGKSEYKSQYTCGAVYDSETSCKHCDEKFESYPEPSISIRRETESKIAVIIRNTAKVAKDEVGSTKLHCVSGMSINSETTIWEIEPTTNRQSIGDDAEVVWIESKDDFQIYRCQVFVYPNLTVLTSEELIVANRYHNIVANITVDFDPIGMPYKTHVEQGEALKDILEPLLQRNEIITFKLMALYPKIGNTTTLSFNIYQPKMYEDFEDYYKVLTRNLPEWYSIASCEYCMSTEIIMENNTLTWPTSRLGKIIPTTELFVTLSGLPITRSCEGNFKQGANWSEPHLQSFVRATSLTQKLYDVLMNKNLTANQTIVTVLKTINTKEEIIPYDVYLIAACLERTVQSDEQYDVKIAIEIIEITMTFDQGTLRSSQLNLNATDMLLYSYDMILQNQGTYDGVPVLIRGNQTIGQVVHINGESNGIAVYKTSGGSVLVKSLNVSYEQEINKTDLILASYFPMDLLLETRNLIEPEDINGTFLASSVFLNNKLFNDEEIRPNWQVMNMFVTGIRKPFLPQGLQVIFGERYEHIDSESQRCAYWNYGINDQFTSIFGKWKDDGWKSSTSNYKICEFDHLTHFALLFGAPENDGIVLVTTIMTSVSLFCVLTIFLTAICFRSWRRGESTKVLLNYCGSILLQNILILISDFVDYARHTVLCTLYGVLLHYSILVQFTWMLIIIYIQYFKLVRVFQSSLSDNTVRLYSVAWLISAIPIIVVLSVNINSYNTTYYCFINGLNLYLGLLLPISLIMPVNVILFIAIIISLFKGNATAMGRSIIKYKIKVCILLFFISGFAWIFGLLANAFQNVVLSYIFSISAIAQGLLLWVYFVLTKKEVANLWVQKFLSGVDFVTRRTFKIPRPSLGKSNSTKTSAANSD